MLVKILFITNIPSPYRVAFFNELGKICRLTVVFERSESTERDNSWKNYSFKNFEGIILEGKAVKRDSAFSFKIISYLKKRKYDWIIVANTISTMGLLEVMYMKTVGVKYWIEGDGAFVPERELRVKKFLKRFLLSGAQGYLSTCNNHDQYYLTYAAKQNQIFRYPFTSLEKKDILAEIVSKEEKRDIRQQLKMKEPYVVVTVGQFIHRKGLDVLIRACRYLKDDIGIYFIGAGEFEIPREVEQIHFVPFQLKQDLQRFYDAADVFVCPTREDIWGLVINEALARGLPVVTTDRCNAGLELVKNGENGYIVPAEDEMELAEKIKKVLYEDDWNKLGRKALESIQNYTVEKMAARHIDIFREMVK